MKLERINDNQIRITLDPHDFADLDVSITDFLTDKEGKTKEFLETLMGKAKDDLDFEADGLPVIVEVTQSDKDSIVLMLTKVDKDTKIAPGTHSNSAISRVAEIKEELEEIDEHPNKDVSSHSLDGEKVITPSYGVCRFKNLDDVISVAKMAENYYDSDNSLYKDDDSYYLMYTRTRNSEADFRMLSNQVREFGEPVVFHYASRFYIEEHYDLIIANEALQLLSET